MDKKIKNFNDTEIEKYKFHQHKKPIFVGNIDANQTVVSNKTSFGKNDFKYFIAYSNAKKADLYAYAYMRF